MVSIDVINVCTLECVMDHDIASATAVLLLLLPPGASLLPALGILPLVIALTNPHDACGHTRW